MHNQGVLSAQELDEQIHESVEHVCLVEVTDRVHSKYVSGVHN